MRTGLIAVIGILGLLGCGKDDEPRAPADAIPQATDAISGSVTLGAVGTRTRERVQVDAVKLTRTPITVGDYRRCVDAGVCSPPSRADIACRGAGLDGKTWTDSPNKRESLPVTCASPEQASKYCRWVGGRLPRVDEWLLAARGSEVHRYPWGDTPPRCDQAMRLQFHSGDPLSTCGGSLLGDDMMVGKHSAGRGAGVLEDVLMSRGEYVSGLETPEKAACVRSTCVVRGNSPGAIEVFVPPGTDADLEAAGFRCAWAQ